MFPITKVDTAEVRSSFLEGLSRICLALGVGHFLCIPPLYLAFGGYPTGRFHLYYITTIALSGAALLGIAFLCRYTKLRGALSYFSLGILFVQAVFFLSEERTLYGPVTMFFPMLCAIAAPMVGRRHLSYFAASASSVTLLFFHFIIFKQGWGGLPALTLMHVVLFFTAFVSESMWARIRRREFELEHALESLRAKNTQMEAWIEQLGRATSLISTGHVGASLPGPAPSRVFDELTRSMGEMQAKVREYFTSVFLEDRLNSLGVLASGVAHELNTPLTTMHFLVAGSKEIPEETKKSLIQEINRLSGIAKSLLSFARPRTEAEVTDLNEIVRSAEPLLKPVGRDRIRLELTLCPEPLPIRALANEIQQILLNLYLNAVDALEGRPDPFVRLSTETTAEGSVVLSVQDNGAGIPQGLLAKILTPFFTTKQPGKGTGLGLFIIHQIATRHEAKLLIDSDEGKGTRVRLVFALAPDQRKVA